MSATQTFASTGEDAISRSIDVQTQETPKHDSDEFNLYYEIERTARLIEEGDYKRVSGLEYVPLSTTDTLYR